MMQTRAKVSIGITLAFLVVIVGEIGYIHYKNNQQAPVKKSQYAQEKYDPDDDVFIRKMHPVTLQDEKDLIGKTIWVSAGSQLAYYPYVDHHAEYAHPVGTLLGATPLIVTGVFEQVPPNHGVAVLRIPAGKRHVLLAFTMPKSSDPKTEYAVPVGNYDANGYNFYTDEIFFYDDPHKLYSYWGTAMWAHIDKHEPALGMSENQAMLALGQVMKPHGDTMGNRSVTYFNNGKPVTLTFENGKAVSMQWEKQYGD
jgi:hypothetical protein